MFKLAVALSCTALIFLNAGCGGSSTTIDDRAANATAFDWQLRQGVPLPVEPTDNPMSEAKFQLGRHLFYDTRLSGNGTQSCASCHHQDKAFTDGLVVAIGSQGDLHPRNSQTLANAGYNATLTWANSSLTTIEHQILSPLFGEDPLEQGITEDNRATVLQRIMDEPRYADLFAAAFPDEGSPVHFDNIIKAIACFTRGLTSFNSAFDRYETGNRDALSAAAKRGMGLFFSEELECFHCHGSYNFSDSTVDRSLAFIERPFHNTGLYNLNGNGDFPPGNQGLIEITGDPANMGMFRAPTLRNIGLTAPYMHDGSMASLDEVLEFYAAGGRVITSGPNAGDGRINPFKDGFVNGFTMSEQDKQDLIAFLHSLTDTEFTTTARFGNPWTSP